MMRQEILKMNVQWQGRWTEALFIYCDGDVIRTGIDGDPGERRSREQEETAEPRLGHRTAQYSIPVPILTMILHH